MITKKISSEELLAELNNRLSNSTVIPILKAAVEELDSISANYSSELGLQYYSVHESEFSVAAVNQYKKRIAEVRQEWADTKKEEAKEALEYEDLDGVYDILREYNEVDNYIHRKLTRANIFLSLIEEAVWTY